MGTGPVSTAAATPPGPRHAGGPVDQKRVAAGLAVLRAAVRAPVTGRARREFLFCLAGLPFVVPIPLTGFYLTVILGMLASGQPNPPWWAVLAGGVGAVGLCWPGHIPRRDAARRVRRLRGGRGDDPRGSLAGESRRVGGPVAHPGHARARQARAAGPRPGADQGAGGR